MIGDSASAIKREVLQLINLQITRKMRSQNASPNPVWWWTRFGGWSALFVKDTQLPLKEHNSEHPFPVFNRLNAYQWLLYIPLHNLRHDQQIAEVKATPGYPS